MSKYEPLETFLKNKGLTRIRMSFGEIEALIHDKLPPSARKHRAWWSNNPSNSVITHAWLGAGYRTAEVDLGGEKVTFVRSERATAATPARPVRHPVFGCMKGTVTIPEGTDLTAPADPGWADLVEEV